MSVSTIIVTGAAAGVGRALVGLLLDRGMTVIASDIDEAGLASLRDLHAGRRLAVSTCDVGVRADCDAFMERTLAEFPEVDGLVNNAGLYLGRPVWDYDDETIERIKRTYNMQSLSKENPVMPLNDPVAKFIGLRRGQLCEITRTNETSGTFVTYRFCK